MDVSFLENQPYYQKSYLQGEKILQEDQCWMLPLSICSHTTEHADVEETNIIQPSAIVENVDSNLMV